IREDNRFAPLPIIAMTAHATVEERNRCLAAGMNDHISKPINPNILIDTVARYYRPATTAPLAPPREVWKTGSVAESTPNSPTRAVSTQVEAIRAVAGLDIAEGLLRVAGNKKLYLKLLRQFADSEHDAPSRIRERLASQDWATAERMAHTVK